MHPNATFRWEDRDALREMARAIGFGMLFAATPDGPRVAHVPFVFLDEERIGLHLARGHALTRHLDGHDALFVVNGPDGYISPDWYNLDNNQVPTWNYLALELEGTVRKLDRDALIDQIESVTQTHESRLAPKPAWTLAKMDADLRDKMISAITGFELRITAWRATAKLGQHKPEVARLAAADAAEASGQRAIAHLMRNPPA